MSYYVWVGPRDVDCFSDTLFSEKICYYSDSNPQEIRKENIYGDTFNKFISNKMTEIYPFTRVLSLYFIILK